MAHFAKVNDGVVQQVIVVSNEDCGGGDFPDSEPLGQAYIASLGIEGEWRQTSYHANFRVKYAGQGDTFDPTVEPNGAFISPERDSENGN